MPRACPSSVSAGSRARCWPSGRTGRRRRRARRSGGPGTPAPGPRLGDIVAERLTALGAVAEDVQWDSRKRGDNSWQVQLMFTIGGRPQLAEWAFDPRRRHVIPADDDAARLSLPEADLAELAPAPQVPALARATVTPISSRLAAAAASPAAEPLPASPPVHETRAHEARAYEARARRPGPRKPGGRSQPCPRPGPVKHALMKRGLVRHAPSDARAAEARGAEPETTAPAADSREAPSPPRPGGTEGRGRPLPALVRAVLGRDHVRQLTAAGLKPTGMTFPPWAGPPS